MEMKFNKGDIVKHPLIEKELTVLRYLDNFNDAVFSHLFSDSVKDEPYEISTIVLCKWDNNGKEKKEKFEQDSLILIKKSYT